MPWLRVLAQPGTVVAAIGDHMRGRGQGVEDEAGTLVVAHLAFWQEQDDRPSIAKAYFLVRWSLDTP